jgi:DNA polymerase III sliding clamp (beta) subunit (PCNA family)
MSTATQEREAAELVAAEVPAVELRNALSACLLAASKDRMLPVLNAVHVSKASNELTFRSTDRYRLVHVTVTLSDWVEGDWETLIDVADAKRLVAMLPKTGNAYAPQLATIMPDTVALMGAGSASFTPVDGEFPRTAQIIPSETVAVEKMGFRPAQLADLNKMPGRGKNEPAVFEFAGDRKPVVIRWGQHPTAYLYMIMPVRVDS